MEHNESSTHITRREALSTVAVLAGAALVTANKGDIAMADEISAPARPPTYKGEHQRKPLPFDPAKLKGLSEKLLTSHHQNNYGGAVNG